MIVKDKKVARRKVDKSESTVAPTAGLNTRDPLALMGISYATNLTNFIATPQGVSVREGNRDWATGMPGYVNTVMPYKSVAGGSDKLFAAVGDEIYDVTSSGAVGAPVLTGLLSDKWDYVNFGAAAGQVLVISNGLDAVKHWNGSVWITWTTVATPSTPGQISGVSPNVLGGVISHQRRLWFVQTGTSVAWYTPVNSIGGAMQSFDFGPLFIRGGTLKAIISWTVNNANGMQNRLVAVSEEGDVVIYSGTDPSDDTKWQLEGTWRLGAPVDEKCFFNKGGDVLYLCTEGLVPLSKYLQTVNTTVAISDNIQPTISSLAQTQAGLYGWQIYDYLDRNVIILNVPQIDPDSNVQLIYNTITGGWSLFTGWGAQCWATLGTEIFFGANGKVVRAFKGYRDNADVDGEGGDTYTASAQSAYNYFEKRAVNKYMKMARINIISSTTSPSLSIACNMDFSVSPPDSVASPPSSNTSVWNTAIWNSGVWTDTLATFNEWQSISGVGYCASISLAIQVSSETVWVSTDWVFEEGGILG